MESFLNNPNFAILINAYRESLVRRYSEENISRFPQLQQVEREVIDRLVYYFLELLYPEYETRIELDNAFRSLAGFVKSPRKFLGIVGNMGYAIMKFGKHLLSGIKAGSAALSSYVTAHRFENTLFGYAEPMIRAGVDLQEEEQFNLLVAKISYQEADEFRKNIVSLFKTLANRPLLEKIILINEHVIEKMKAATHIYSQTEIKGIEMGLDILKRGKVVFAELPEETVAIILRGIDTVEKDFFDRAYALAQSKQE
ncbi:MAG: hypothetical protein AAF518_02950 [Spirochaetota bacterium]